MGNLAKLTFYEEMENDDFEHLESESIFVRAVQEIRDISGPDKFEVTATFHAPSYFCSFESWLLPCSSGQGLPKPAFVVPRLCLWKA